MILEDLAVTSQTYNDVIISEIHLEGGTIGANGNNTYQTTGSVAFQQEEFFDEIKNHIQGHVGFTILGFYSKKMPLNITVIGNIHDIVEDISLPDISINLDFDQLLESGIHCNGSIDIYNPNQFSMSLTQLSIIPVHEMIGTIGNITIPKNVNIFPGHSSFQIIGNISYEALNPGRITATIQGKANALAAGINLTRNLTAQATIIIPNLATFLLQNEELDITLLADFDVLATGISAHVGLQLYNPTKIPLTADDLICSIYRVDNTSQRLLVSESMENCISIPEQKTCVMTNLLIPYQSFLPQLGETILPEWFSITISGNFSIADTNQQLPVSINGLISPRFLSINDV